MKGAFRGARSLVGGADRGAVVSAWALRPPRGCQEEGHVRAVRLEGAALQGGRATAHPCTASLSPPVTPSAVLDAKLDAGITPDSVQREGGRGPSRVLPRRFAKLRPALTVSPRRPQPLSRPATTRPVLSVRCPPPRASAADCVGERAWLPARPWGTACPVTQSQCSGS